MQNVAGDALPKTGPSDPPNYAAKVPADQWYGTGQAVPPTQTQETPTDQYSEEFSAQPEEEYYQDPQTGQFFPGYLKPQPEELVFAWEAGDRPFKKRKKQFFMTAGTIAALISLILFFSGQFLVIAVVIAVLFVIYMLYTFPPHTIMNQITTYGIRNGENLYYWEELGRFWFEKRMGQEIVLVEVSRFPNRLTLVLGEVPRETIEMILSEILLQEKPPLTPVEKAAAWLQEKIPLDLDE